MKFQRFILQESDLPLADFCENVYELCDHFQRFCVLDSGENADDVHASGPHQYQLLGGFGEVSTFTLEGQTLEDLDAFFKKNGNNWYFGHLSYDLKNIVEKKLYSALSDPVGFPLLSFFIPEIIIAIRKQDILLISNSNITPGELFLQLNTRSSSSVKKYIKEVKKSSAKALIPDFKSYIKTINLIQDEMQRGTVYELNYCLPITLENTSMNPLNSSRILRNTSPAPFSCLYKQEDKWLLSASPERWIRKEDHLIFSQPMKGTAPRSPDPNEDQKLSDILISDEKERAENVMIVDLVRNDLSKVAERGSVRVKELCGVYHFPKVHQLISTVSAELKEDLPFSKIIEALFPMGSMTGAPKVEAMTLIEKLELFKRGLFSGSVGYIAPDGDFDFNVVIRSILLNASTNKILIPAGSAITAKSNPASEYAECILKAKALMQVSGISFDTIDTV